LGKSGLMKQPLETELLMAAASRRARLDDFGDETFRVLRCFLWVVWELGNSWDSQIELTGSVVGGGSEVDEVLESPSHSLC